MKPLTIGDFLIREAVPDDAEALLDHLRRLLSEGPVMIPKRLEEMTLTVAQEKEFLQQMQAAPNSVFLLAEQAGQIVGNIDLQGYKRQAMRHVAVLGMSIQVPWRGQGLGALLMNAALTWARGSGVLRRIELFVYAENAPAIALYQKFGFELEGRRKGMIRDGDAFLDDLLMGLCLDD